MDKIQELLDKAKYKIENAAQEGSNEISQERKYGEYDYGIASASHRDSGNQALRVKQASEYYKSISPGMQERMKKNDDR